MLIPKRLLPAVKEEPKLVEVRTSNDDSKAMIKVTEELHKIKDQLSKRRAPKYVFSMLRDPNGLLTEVVATPVESDAII